jgi:hypothetical protein
LLEQRDIIAPMAFLAVPPAHGCQSEQISGECGASRKSRAKSVAGSSLGEKLAAEIKTLARLLRVEPEEDGNEG